VVLVNQAMCKIAPLVTLESDNGIRELGDLVTLGSGDSGDPMI